MSKAPRKHMSKNGLRDCFAQSVESCRAEQMNGEPAQHFDNTPEGIAAGEKAYADYMNKETRGMILDANYENQKRTVMELMNTGLSKPEALDMLEKHNAQNLQAERGLPRHGEKMQAMNDAEVQQAFDNFHKANPNSKLSDKNIAMQIESELNGGSAFPHLKPSQDGEGLPRFGDKMKAMNFAQIQEAYDKFHAANPNSHLSDKNIAMQIESELNGGSAFPHLNPSQNIDNSSNETPLERMQEHESYSDNPISKIIENRNAQKDRRHHETYHENPDLVEAKARNRERIRKYLAEPKDTKKTSMEKMENIESYSQNPIKERITEKNREEKFPRVKARYDENGELRYDTNNSGLPRGGRDIPRGDDNGGLPRGGRDIPRGDDNGGLPRGGRDIPRG